MTAPKVPLADAGAVPCPKTGHSAREAESADGETAQPGAPLTPLAIINVNDSVEPCDL